MVEVSAHRMTPTPVPPHQRRDWVQDSKKARTETIHDGKGSSLVRRVELTGLEPVTPCLQSRCATNCAIAPLEELSPPRRP